MHGNTLSQDLDAIPGYEPAKKGLEGNRQGARGAKEEKATGLCGLLKCLTEAAWLFGKIIRVYDYAFIVVRSGFEKHCPISVTCSRLEQCKQE